MKTQTPSKKAIGATLIALAVSGSAIAQNGVSAASDEASNHLTLALSVLLFIVGFAVLIVLKIRDDKKHQQEDASVHNHPHILHRNHYGHRHQYHH